MDKNKSTWLFKKKPKIISTGVVGGPFERNGPLVNDFDRLYEDLWLNEDSYEKAHRKLFEHACEVALEKAALTKEDIQFLFAGDLVNQLTPTNFAARSMEIPVFGLFSACATSMEGLALASFVINHLGANYVLTGTSSHNAAIEKQFRYPTEYGGQKPPTSQWTVTGAGACVVSLNGKGPVISSATIGKVVDMKMSDPFNMGGAMAPAAVDTITRHLRNTQSSFDEFDYIVTGDLGRIGREVAFDLLHEHGVKIPSERFIDCGILIYDKKQPVFAGGSGAACSAVVTYGHLLEKMKKGEFHKMLVVATGSLHSPLTYQQNETIPCIAHAVVIENER